MKDTIASTEYLQIEKDDNKIKRNWGILKGYFNIVKKGRDCNPTTTFIL